MHSSIAGLIAQVITTILSRAGYAGLCGLMAIESACIPLPSEIILPFAGYMVSLGKMNLFLAATVAAIGCNIGSEIAYEIGRYGGRPIAERWGWIFLITPQDLLHADRFFARFGRLAVLIARLLPVVRTFIAFPAGMVGMHRARFHIYTFIGSWPWCFALVFAGMKLGQAWASDPRMHTVFHYADYVVVAAILAVLARFAWHRWRSPRHPI